MNEVTQIYEQMLQTYREKTGVSLQTGADLAVRLYAAAAQIQNLQAQADYVLRQSFPQTASGDYLDRHAALRGLSRREAVKAEGVLRFLVPSAGAQPLTVPAGTAVCNAEGVRFVTTQAGTVAAGQTFAEIPAQAAEAGSAGNAPAGTVVCLTAPPQGIRSVTNPQAFAGGRDAEDDESLRARVLDSFRSLPNGANAAFYEARAMEHPGVAAVTVLPRYAGIGTVGVVIAAQSGQTPAALLEEVEEDLQSVREIAVDVSVLEPDYAQTDVEISITPKPGVRFETAQAAAEAAVRGFFTGKLLGKPVYVQALGRAVYDTGLVENYRITAPAQDLAAEAGTLPVLGECDITEAEA